MAKEILHTAEDFYIVANSFGVDERTRVLKHDDTFAVFNVFGDAGTMGLGDEGIYHHDTRYLSGMSLCFGDRPPVLLSSTIRKDNAVLTIDLTNADIPVGEVIAAPRGMLHLYRAKLLWRGACYERLRIHNYGHMPMSLPLDLTIDCDFADIFEIRGMERSGRGKQRMPVVTENLLQYVYEGVDDRLRSTLITFDPAPMSLEAHHAKFEVRVPPRQTVNFEWTVSCELEGERQHTPVTFQKASHDITRSRKAAENGEPIIKTGNELFDRWIERSLADLRMLRTETPYGPYEYAGVPWFSTVFGRDGIITALETLWFDPEIARGVLSYLAATQATTDDPESDAQPGKILHETRDGEMSAVRDVPFARYYGSIDSTPLFVMLAGAYYERSGDLSFIKALWPHVEAALAWIDTYGDIDGDGFLEYARRTKEGLAHQGWKDSSDPVFHADGTLAEAPIALCEVQAYVFSAKLEAARLAQALGLLDEAAELNDQAEELRQRFERIFWVPEIETYGLALDAEKNLCRVRTSNAGHCLYAGIADPGRAALVVQGFMDEEFFSGWGVRTVSSIESRYNPMSYHNGSIWPHDNAMIAAGMAAYGHKKQAAQVMSGLFDASLSFDLHRLPELFCGFHRRPDEDPTQYPVACSPQAWAAGAVILLLQACTGLEVHGTEGLLLFNRPYLPDFLPKLQIHGLPVGTGVVDVVLHRVKGGLELDVLHGEGNASVELVQD